MPGAGGVGELVEPSAIGAKVYVVLGVTMGVWMWLFISSSESTVYDLAVRILLPTVGSRAHQAHVKAPGGPGYHTQCPRSKGRN